MRVALGGTFDVLHRGHEALLDAAIARGGRVLVGLTSDGMASAHRSSVRPFAERRKSLEDFFAERRFSDYEIHEINDVFGPASSRADLDALVVSETRAAVGGDLNRERERRGLRPLAVHIVPMVLADDSCPISATRVKAGEVDRDGRMLRPLRVRVGSDNPVKASATRDVFRQLFGPVRVRRVKVDVAVPPQPLGEDTMRGAVARARAARGDADYGVGIEAGLVASEAAGHPFDVQVCAVVDKRDVVTVGHGPGFVHPPAVLEKVRGGATVGEAMEALAGVADIGRKEGAIGFLTAGRYTRRQLTRQAVLMAMVPRLRRELYASLFATTGTR